MSNYNTKTINLVEFNIANTNSSTQEFIIKVLFTVCRVLMATTACFIIVSRNDIPIYEAEVGSATKV